MVVVVAVAAVDAIKDTFSLVIRCVCARARVYSGRTHPKERFSENENFNSRVHSRRVHAVPSKLMRCDTHRKKCVFNIDSLMMMGECN